MDKVSKFLKVFNYIDPLFLYIPIIFYTCKAYQWSFGKSSSVWENLWETTQSIFGGILGSFSELKINFNDYLFIGDDPFNYCVVLFNLYVNLFYWAFGGALIAMEILNRPKKFNQYKIQRDQNTLADNIKMRKVGEKN